MKSIRHTEPGSALLIAALIAMLLGAAAAITLIGTRSTRVASSEQVRLARAQLAADAMLAEAIVRLDAGEMLPAQSVAPDGARLARQDAVGLVDLNTAPPEQLSALMTGLGLRPERAQMLADRIADWRDADDLKRLNGAERAEYEAAHRVGPGNRPFEVESELASVLGADPALVSCLAPYLTVYSGADAVDASAAAPTLRALLALPDQTATAPGAPLGRVIELTAEAPLSPHAFLRKSLWVRLTGDPAAPFVIHRALQTFAAPADQAAACGGAR